MSLFRKEVLEHHGDRLHGEIQILVPVSWQTVGALFFLIVACALVFLSLASYARTEIVAGAVLPQSGVSRIVPSRPGVIFDLPVTEGERVKEGDIVAFVKTDENLVDGSGSSSRIIASLDSQLVQLELEQEQVIAAATAEKNQYTTRIAGLENDIGEILGQIAAQERMVQNARTDLERAQRIASRGFVSGRDIMMREETVLGREQQLSQLRQSLESKRNEVIETRAAILRSAAATTQQLAGLDGRRSELDQRRAAAEVSGAYTIVAPATGVITALTARDGQAVSPQSSIMSIVPTASDLHVELYVPSTAIGFVEVGQDVAVAIDAFPYQRFGTLPAKVSSISAAPANRIDDRNGGSSMYLVVATLEKTTLRAFGKDEQLIAGMSLTARIRLEKQTLVEWIFEPIYSVGW